MDRIEIKASSFQINKTEIEQFKKIYSEDSIIKYLDIMKEEVKEKGRIESPGKYLKDILNKNCNKINSDTKIKLELSYTEYANLTDDHGKDFIDLKIKDTEKLADKFKIKNLKELLIYLIDSDSESNKYGINPLIQNSLKEFQKLISSEIDSLNKNSNNLTEKLIDSHKDNLNKTTQSMKAITDKLIHQSKDVFEDMRHTAKETIIPDLENITVKMEDKFKKSFDVTTKGILGFVLGILFLGMFAGIYMQPIIAQLTERAGMHYTLVYILLCSVAPLVAGAAITAFFFTKILRN